MPQTQSAPRRNEAVQSNLKRRRRSGSDAPTSSSSSHVSNKSYIDKNGDDRAQCSLSLGLPVLTTVVLVVLLLSANDLLDYDYGTGERSVVPTARRRDHPGGTKGTSTRMPTLASLASSGDKDRSVFLGFDSNFSIEHTLRPSGKTVHVGMQGPNVIAAVQHGLANRMKGYPRRYFDVIATDRCFGSTNYSDATDAERKLLLPEAILIGVQKGGTTALETYLHRHPKIAKTKKEFYFLDDRVDRLILQQYRGDPTTESHTSDGNNNTSLPPKHGIPRKKAREAYHAVMKAALRDGSKEMAVEDAGPGVSPHTFQDGLRNKRDSGMILDLTPNYLFESDRLPARIKCIVPGAKLMVLLRNPVDRARSQYDMKLRFVPKKPNGSVRKRNDHGHPIPTFDEYVRNDVAALTETGVLHDWSKVPFDEFWESPALDEAWRTYLNSGLNAPVGMGLYAIQLRPFLNLSSSPMLVLRSEELQLHTDEVYNDALEFLGLPLLSLGSYPSANSHGHRKHEMENSTRSLLQEVFRPFNSKLAELLGDEKWARVWED